MTPAQAIDAVADIAVSVLPRSASPLERALLAAELARVATVDPTVIVRIWNPATCPPELLAHLAQAVSVDVWSDSWSEAQKRAVIAASPAVHRLKGTLGAVKRALAAFDLSVRVVEWWEDDSRRGTFRVEIIYQSGGPAYDHVVNGFAIQSVDSAKPKSRVFGARAILRARGGVYLGAFARLQFSATANPFIFTVPTLRATNSVGATGATFFSATAHKLAA